MKRNRILTRIALFFSVLMLLTSTVQTTYGLIVTQTDPLINIFTPSEVKMDGLLLTKYVEHPFSDSYVIPDNIAFDYKVDLGAHYANTNLDTTNGTVKADDNGSLTVSVKPGKPVTVEGIDEGTAVTVTELQKTDSGFSVKDGVTSKEAIVSADGTLTVSFTNVYTPAAADPIISVIGTKTLEGREWLEGDSFDFLLEMKSGDGSWAEFATETVTADTEGHAFDFTEAVRTVSYDHAGAYEFRVSEIIGTLENMAYDKTVNHFTVNVGDRDMDGSLEIRDVTVAENAAVTVSDSGEYAVNVTFNNTFVPPVIPVPQDITVPVTVKKTVVNTGTLKIGPDGFRFILENTDTGDKMSLTADKDGMAVADLTYTAADAGKIFTYTLAEQNDGREDVIYDQSVHKITVAVTLGEDNILRTAITVDGEDTDEIITAFENIYHVEEDPAPPTADDGSHVRFWLVMTLVSGIVCAVLVQLEKRYRVSMK